MSDVTLLTAAQKNEHYGKLNERFDVRNGLLYRMGYRREAVPALNIAVYVKTRFGRVHAIPAAVLTCADEIVWADHMEEAKRFCA